MCHSPYGVHNTVSYIRFYQSLRRSTPRVLKLSGHSIHPLCVGSPSSGASSVIAISSSSLPLNDCVIRIGHWVAETLLADRLVDRYRRPCRELYLMASGLRFSANIIAAMPTLMDSIKSLLTPVLLNCLLDFDLRERQADSALLCVDRERRRCAGDRAGGGHLVRGEWPHVPRKLRAHQAARGRVRGRRPKVPYVVSSAQLGTLMFLILSTELQTSTCIGSHNLDIINLQVPQSGRLKTSPH